MVSGFGCQVSAVVFPVADKKDSPQLSPRTSDEPKPSC